MVVITPLNTQVGQCLVQMGLHRTLPAAHDAGGFRHAKPLEDPQDNDITLTSGEPVKHRQRRWTVRRGGVVRVAASVDERRQIVHRLVPGGVAIFFVTDVPTDSRQPCGGLGPEPESFQATIRPCQSLLNHIGGRRPIVQPDTRQTKQACGVPGSEGRKGDTVAGLKGTYQYVIGCLIMPQVCRGPVGHG